MSQLYTLIAKRDTCGPHTLTVRYEDRAHAIAAAAVLREFCPVVRIIDGEGTEMEESILVERSGTILEES
jgi:hypothetical protein